MKKIIISILLLSGFCTAYAQKPSDIMKSLFKNKEYDKASAYITDAIRENPKDVDLIIMGGDIYFEVEKYDSALTLYKKADDLKSDVPAVLRKIGRTYSYMGNHPEAVKAIRHAIKEDKNDVYSLLELGKAYIKADSLKEATLIITKAREMNKSVPDAYIALGDLYYTQEVYELARSNYEEALAKDENLTDARIKLATAYYKLANKEQDPQLSDELFNRSLKEWNIVTQKDPNNAKAYYEQGKILFLGRKYTDAALSFYKYIELRPSGSLGRWYLAQSLYEIGNCDSAAPQLKIVSEQIDSVKNKARLKLAQCYFDKKMFKESIDAYNLLKPAIKLEEIDQERLAVAYLKTGDTTSSINTYKEIIDNDNTKTPLMYQLGSLTLFMKDYKNSIYFFNKYISYGKDTAMLPKSYYYLGYCYFNLSNPDSSIYFLDKSIQLDAASLSYRIMKGDAISSKAQKSEDADSIKDLKKQALDEFKMVIDKASQDTAKYSKELNTAYTKYCGLQLDAKDFKKLENTAKQWTDIDPKAEFAWLYLGIAYQGQADKESACKSYKKVLQVNPKNMNAKKLIQQLGCE